MARTPYQDPEAEAEYQKIVNASSKPMGDASQPQSAQGKTNDTFDNYMDNQDMAKHRSNTVTEDWVREKDSEIQGQRNKRRNR